MRGGVFRPGYPISISQLKDVVETANSGNARTLGASVDTQSGESGPAYQPTGTQVSILRIVKVTGTVTGGYSFTEVHDPDGDGAYTTSPYGINSVSTSVYLVAKSGITFATDDIVVARLNPYHPHRWEALCILGRDTTNVIPVSFASILGSDFGFSDNSAHNVLTLSVAAGKWRFSYQGIGQLLSVTIGDQITMAMIISSGTGTIDTNSGSYVGVIQVTGVQVIATGFGEAYVNFSTAGTVALSCRRTVAAAVTTAKIQVGASLRATPYNF